MSYARLLRRVFRVGFEPQSIRAEVDLAGPFETAATFTDMHLRKDGRIGLRREHAPAYEVIEAAHRGRSVCPDEGHAVRARIGQRIGDDVIQQSRRRYILSGDCSSWHLIQRCSAAVVPSTAGQSESSPASRCGALIAAAVAASLLRIVACKSIRHLGAVTMDLWRAIAVVCGP
jgi:hypothetical protein